MGLLTKVEQGHLKYLKRLLDYGSLQLKMGNSFKSQFTHLQNFLLFNHVAIHNYSEAIYLLCKDARPHPAHILVRSLFEAYTNTEYIRHGDSERKLALFSKEGFAERKKIANGFDQFIKKYPSKKNSLSILKEETIEEMKIFAERHINGIDSANKLNQKDKYPDILRRSIEIDKDVLDSKDRGDAELYYHLVFRYLSPYAHLNAGGLEAFLEKKADNDMTFITGQAGGIHTITIQTYLYYFASLKNLFQEQILDGKMPDIYQKYFEELKSQKIK